MAEHNTPTFGPARPTVNEMRGIRYAELGDGGDGGAIDEIIVPGAEPEVPAEPAEPGEPAPYVEPNGDEPWFKHLENVPDIIKPDIVNAFREIDSQNNSRYDKVKAFEAIADLAEPDVLRQAHQFAEQLFAPIPLTASAEDKAQIAAWRNNFLDTYAAQLIEQGLREDQAAAAAKVAADAAAEEALGFETPEQKRIRELEQEIAAARADVGGLREFTQQQIEAQQYAAAVDGFKGEWDAVIEKNGQLSEKEFKIVALLAQEIGGDNPPAGTIIRAWNKFATEYGRMPDPNAATATTQVPVVAAGGAAGLPVPPEIDMRNRGNRRRVMMEALEQFQPQSAAE